MKKYNIISDIIVFIGYWNVPRKSFISKDMFNSYFWIFFAHIILSVKLCFRNLSLISDTIFPFQCRDSSLGKLGPKSEPS